MLQDGKYKQAAIQYKKIVAWLENESGLSEENEAKAKALILAAFLNLGMCYLKSKDYSQALENCNKALEHDKNNEKALFRRAEAYLGMNEFESAREDFQVVLHLYPGNKAAKAQLAVCQQRLRQQNERDKKTYANMFQRFAERDAKIAADKGNGGKGDHTEESTVTAKDVEMQEEVEKRSGMEQNEVDKTENIEMEG